VTLYQDPERHWGRKFLEGVNLVLQIMAVVSLLMSVVLVLNTFTALITQQTDQIGVIKAIGGQSGTVVRLYLAAALILGLLALLIAVPVGAAFAFYMAKTYLRLFNIDYDTFQFSRNALSIQVVAAVVAPLLAALWPTLKGAAISVRQAIATYGIGADFGSSALDRVVERFGARLLPPAYAASLGNVFRRKGRLVLTVLVLSVAGAMFLVVMSLISSIQYTLDNDMARRGYDVKIGFVGEEDADQVERVAGEAPGVTAVETWYSRNATILRGGESRLPERLQDSAGLGAQLTGVPPETTMQRPLVVEGRWLTPEDGRAVVMSAETAHKNGMEVGDEVSLNLGELGEAKWQVVGLYRVVYDTGFVVEPVYAPLVAMLEATGKTNVASQVLVTTADKTLANTKAVSDDLRTRYTDVGMKVDFYTTALKQEERDYASNQFSTVIGMLIGLASLVATVGGIGLAGSLSIGVVERTREIGVLRAIGAESRTLTGIFMMEGMIQGALSWMIAVPLSFVLAQPLARLMGQVMLDIDLDFTNNWAAVGVWLAVILAIAACAAMFPARAAAKISVREALAYS
jgi:putative ABC transport system permease protein